MGMFFFSVQSWRVEDHRTCYTRLLGRMPCSALSENLFHAQLNNASVRERINGHRADDQAEIITGFGSAGNAVLQERRLQSGAKYDNA